MATSGSQARWRRSVAAGLLGASVFSLAGCGESESGSSNNVVERTVAEDKIGDAGLAPEEAAGGAGADRGSGGNAG